jgi:hypothetical protein
LYITNISDKDIILFKNKTGIQVIKKTDYDEDILEKHTIKLITSVQGEQTDKLIVELKHGTKLYSFVENVFGRNVINFHLQE